VNWIVYTIARAPKGMFQGRTAELWRLSDPVTDSFTGRASYWVQPSEIMLEHPLLCFATREAAEKWVIEQILIQPDLANMALQVKDLRGESNVGDSNHN